MGQIPDDLIAPLIASTEDVFDKMVFRQLQAHAPVQEQAPNPNVVGTVAFTGGRSGFVVFYCKTDTANEIAGAMLGLAPGQVNGEMPDAIGELTNMIAGAFRTRMAASEHPWAISVPTVTVGSDFHTKYVSNVRRTLCPFSMSDADVFVELILTEH